MTLLYINVIIDQAISSLDKIFQYRVPDSMKNDIEIGRQVVVPFGKSNREMKGFIVGITDHTEYDQQKIKDILYVDQSIPGVEGQMITLAEWMRHRYDTTMVQALKTVLPVKKQVKEIIHRYYSLADENEGKQLLEKSRLQKRSQARVRLLELLLKEKSVSREQLTGTLNISASTINTLVKHGVLIESTESSYRNPYKNYMNGWGQSILNNEQQTVVDDIVDSMNRIPHEWSEDQAVHLLHGITGSGKTEVYMALIEEVLRQGRQIIVLIPEISLTLQTLSRFYNRFGEIVAVMHSRLSDGEKYDQYQRALNGDASIMIGPRSALFTPFKNLGLIIIDEAHESAYKSETTPKYHASEVAIKRAQMSDALVVLGSATPSVCDYMNAESGKYQLHQLSHRAKDGSILPDVSIVDLREEFKIKNRSILSHELYREIETKLERHEQIMLFINRRGYAGFVSCRNCGFVLKCTHCDVALTSHSGGWLKCHYCGYQVYQPKICPSCGSRYIAAFGTGTQKVEEMVANAFPKARILRMDKDTTSGKNDMSRILQLFAEHKADILIGTQMIVKGHDFENVTLVGILAADLSMFSGDYLSSERTFQLLTQAAGRAGRGNQKGKVIIQTYQPDHYAVVSAAQQDYLMFYKQEILFRRMMNYPPITQMLMLLAEGAFEEKVTSAMYKIKQMIEEADFQDVMLIGPAKANISRAKDMYRVVFYMKHTDEKTLFELRDFIKGYIAWSGQYNDIYFNFDLNPLVLA